MRAHARHPSTLEAEAGGQQDLGPACVTWALSKEEERRVVVDELECNRATLWCSALEMYQDHSEQFLKSSVISLGFPPLRALRGLQEQGEETACSVTCLWFGRDYSQPG